jgi:hypothetical protein
MGYLDRMGGGVSAIAEVVTKFDPDQPRNEDGTFAGDGSGGGKSGGSKGKGESKSGGAEKAKARAANAENADSDDAHQEAAKYHKDQANMHARDARGLREAGDDKEANKALSASAAHERAHNAHSQAVTGEGGVTGEDARRASVSVNAKYKPKY